MIHLVVTEAFGSYVRGARITDEAEVKKVLASEHAGRVIRVNAPAKPVEKPKSK